ncbi:MAG: hypothetical protein AAGA69_00745, partial [Pseudomonadota bacterium]
MPLTTAFVILIVLTAGIIAWSYWHEWRVTKARPPAGEMVETSFGQVHAIHHTPDEVNDRAPLVLIHGATTNALDMEIDLYGRLEGQRELFIADRPGHGFSGRPEEGWRLDVQAAQL